jgi:hypothetical protein
MLGNVDFPVLVRVDELVNAFRPDTLVDAVAVLLDKFDGKVQIPAP